MASTFDPLLKLQDGHKITYCTASETDDTPFGADAAKQRFQADPKETIEWILKRSFFDLYAAVCLGKKDYKEIPEAMHVPLLNAILDNLNDFEWYRDTGVESPLGSLRHHVWALLFALKQFSQILIQGNDEMIDLIFKSWRAIIKWLRILMGEADKDEIMVMWRESKRSVCTTVLLYTLASSLKTKINLWEEKEVIEFVFKFWIRQDFNFEAEVYSTMLMSQCIDSTVDSLSRVIKITNWNQRRLMSLAMTRLRSESATSLVANNPLFANIFVGNVRVIMNRGDDQISSLWFDLGVTDALINILLCSIHCCISSSDPERKGQIELIDSCFDTFDRGLHRMSNRKSIASAEVALRHGLLEVLLLSSPYGDVLREGGIGKKFQLTLLQEYLPNLLVLPSCVKYTMMATQALSAEALETISVGHPEYRSAWNDLQRRLSYRMASAAYFRINKHFYRCSNTRCQVTGTRYNFMRCGGCKKRKYCSEDCQRVAWKAQGHGTLCKYIDEETDILDDIRVREYAHITLLAMAEVNRHMTDLHRIATIKFPDRDFNDLCFTVSFATNPPTLELETKQMIEETEKYKHIVKDLLKRVEAYDSSRVALLRIEPLLDLWPDYPDFVYRLVELDKTGFRNVQHAAILEAGKALGGLQRESCIIIGSEKQPLEAEYDIIDEIVRRTNKKMGGRSLLCDAKYAVTMEEEVELLLIELESSDRNVIYV